MGSILTVKYSKSEKSTSLLLFSRLSLQASSMLRASVVPQ